MSTTLDRTATTAAGTDDDLVEKFSDCWATAEGVRQRREAWRRRAAWHRRWFRGTGLLLILLSISLPVVVKLRFQYQELTVTLMSLTIAVLTGLRSFYNWDRVWRSLKSGEFTLTHALDRWKLDMAEYAHQPDTTKAREAAFKRSRELLDEAHRAVNVESEAYFGNLKWPDTR